MNPASAANPATVAIASGGHDPTDTDGLAQGPPRQKVQRDTRSLSPSKKNRAASDWSSGSAVEVSRCQLYGQPLPPAASAVSPRYPSMSSCVRSCHLIRGDFPPPPISPQNSTRNTPSGATCKRTHCTWDCGGAITGSRAIAKYCARSARQRGFALIGLRLRASCA